MLRLFQLIAFVLLVPTVAILTLQAKHRDDDGPSLAFAGGPLMAGPVYRGPEPDWNIIAADTIELQIDATQTSHRVRVLPVNGRLYIASGYMGGVLRRIIPHWAILAQQGNGDALIRVNGVRYPRTLVRVTEGTALEGVVSVLNRKFNENVTRQSIVLGNIWVYELTPRGAGR